MLNAAGLTEKDVPTTATKPKRFREGRPMEPCRQYNESEIAEMQNSLRRGDTSKQSRLAVYLLGLPRSGKSSVLDRVLASWEGLPARKDFALLDMDFLRSFHADFCSKLRQEPIFKDLMPWFNEGANAETLLYKNTDGIVMHCSKRGGILYFPSTQQIRFLSWKKQHDHLDT